MLSKRFKYVPYKHSIPLNAYAKEKMKEFEQSRGELEDLPCMVCSSTEFETVTETDKFGFYYPTGVCKKCGNVQQYEYYSYNDVVTF